MGLYIFQLLWGNCIFCVCVGIDLGRYNSSREKRLGSVVEMVYLILLSQSSSPWYRECVCVRVPTNGTFSNRVTSIQKRRGHVTSICPPPPSLSSRAYSAHTHIYIVFLFIYGEPSTATDLYNTSTLYGLFIKLVHLVGGPGSKEMDWLIRKIVSSQMIFDFGISIQLAGCYTGKFHLAAVHN